MKKCLVIPDSFKGTLTSQEVCEVMRDSILDVFPECQVELLPVSDGGEGLVESYCESLGARKVTTRINSPFLWEGERESFYGRLGDTAIIESAAAVGLPLVQDRKNPATSSTYGVGQLIAHAVEQGCTKILLGLGGTCTNDAGAGMAAALGVCFYDLDGNEFLPTGSTLGRTARIDREPARQFLQNIEIEALCDIDNPMYGETGAAYVFAPQKGADPTMVRLLDENLRAFADRIEQDLHIDVRNLPGGGAAGAMGAGAVAFLGAKLKPGIEVLLDAVDFEQRLSDCDLVFTGEGKFDAQSLRGKVVAGIGQRAKKHKVPVIVVAGMVDGAMDEQDQKQEQKKLGLSRVYGTVHNSRDLDLDEIQKNSRENLRRTMKQVLQDLGQQKKGVTKNAK